MLGDTGASVIWPARVYAGVPTLVGLTGGPGTATEYAYLMGSYGASAHLAVRYMTAVGTRALSAAAIDRDLTIGHQGPYTTEIGDRSGSDIQYTALAWWVTFPRAGRYTIWVHYAAISRTQDSEAGRAITITAVHAPRHGALDVRYSTFPPTYRLYAHASPRTMPETITVVASASAVGARSPSASGTYSVPMRRPATDSLPLPTTVADQAAALGSKGTVTELVYIHAPHWPINGTMTGYTALLPDVYLLPPGQSAGEGGVWGVGLADSDPIARFEHSGRGDEIPLRPLFRGLSRVST